MKRFSISENQALSILGGLAVFTGGLCLVLNATYTPGRAWNFEESVEAVNVVAAIPEALPTERFVPYVWKFGDVYEAREGRLMLRTVLRSRVEAAFDVSWLGAPGSRVQISDDGEFNGGRVHAFTAAAGFLTLKSVFLGENFWRVSADGLRWSKSHRFTVEPEFVSSEVRAQVAGDGLVFSADSFMKKYVVEFSQTAAFAPTATFVYVTSDSRLPLNSYQKGFVRVRGVTENGELTAYSPAVKTGSL